MRAGPSAAVAYVLLAFAALLWAGNAVASKVAVGLVSPQALVALRWSIALTAIALMAGRETWTHRRALLARWPMILLMGGLGYTGFNALTYEAGALTSAVNLSLIEGTIPVLVLALNLLVRGVTVRPGQILGSAITLSGVVLVASHGDLARLAALDLNHGDLLVLLACLFYAGYTIALPSRPAVPALAFFAAMAVAAWATSMPLLIGEWASGRVLWPGAAGWGLIAFTALGPSLVAQLAYMRGVETIGPNRAGLFNNLVPVFGAILAVGLVGEPFGAVEAVALALVLGGIAVAEFFGRKAV
ncbi:DMT family transporter [Methylobacterium terricola]|uniref:DMT family transporter n=1 Tax=Methylobacterium terricola TaxID=2583531 RepID=A0A5C4LCB1_9HYPH|nr:DMT family transporter [Methylobacterium terricola]TNC09362.1 DMT family transporter [Methylobacterium terricola]